MHVSILDLINFVRITVVREPAEARTIEVDSKGLVASNQNVNAHVKLLATNQQRIHDVPLHDIRLSLWTFRLPSKIVLPLSYLRQFIQQKDALSLGLANRFHNPNLANLSELFNK